VRLLFSILYSDNNFAHFILNDSPFHSISFLLPMMCQITMDIEGCEALISSGGYKAVSWSSFQLNVFSWSTFWWNT
jgi:hypothetical protein